jgi:hypothetical protein
VDGRSPIPHHRRRDANLRGNLHQRPTATFKQRNGLPFEFGSELPPRFGLPNTFPAQPSVSKVSTDARDQQ